MRGSASQSKWSAGSRAKLVQYLSTVFQGASRLVYRVSRSMLMTCSTYAPADLYVLLSWSCGLYTVYSATNTDASSTLPWKTLIAVMATLLELILNKSTPAKDTLRKGALVRTRRSLRSVGRASSLQSTMFTKSRETRSLNIFRRS